MKKTLLLGGVLLSAIFTQAQQRLVLYEEFSGENCAPCAATNPGLMTTLNGNPNTLLIKYQTPIPSAGPIYNQNTVDVQNRANYYNVPFAPYGRLDGAVSPGATDPNNAGHPGYLTAAHLTAEAAIASPFNITVTNTVSGSTATPTINITAVSAYSGTNVKLRVALVEDLYFTTPPGTNGETEFHHVMRKFLGTAGGDGKSISNTWTAGQTLTVTDMTATIPTYVDRTHNVFYIVWIQDDGNKSVAQAAKSTNLPPATLDATVFSATPESGKIFCGTPTITHSVKVKNTGSTAINSVNIYTKYGPSGSYGTPQVYSTPIAAGATTGDIAITSPVPSNATSITDSIGYINGTADLNPMNNALQSDIAILSTGGSLPVSTSFEANTIPSGFIVLDKNGGAVSVPVPRGETWFTRSYTDVTAYDGTYTALADATSMPTGATTIFAFPYTNAPSGAKAVDFAYAYAQRGTISGDKLEVVYSTDCGVNWTSVWSKSGADLATAPAVASNQLFVPEKVADYKTASVDVSAANGNVLVGFRATSGQGNLIVLDKVNYRTGAPTVGVEEIVTGGQFSIYPNPVNDFINVELNLTKKSEVSFTMVNILGQQVGATVTKTLNPGQNNTQIATSSLANGIYFMNVTTEKGSIQQKFVKQ